MSRSYQLYNLVKSLSRGEKRQFKIHSSKYEKSKKSPSIQLFDVIDNLDQWEEELFNKKLVKSGIDKHIAVHTNALVGQLLSSLRLKEEQCNSIFIVNRLVEESMILFARDDFKLALNRIQKAKNLSLKAELYEKLVEILNQERDIQFRLLGTVEYNTYRFSYNEEVEHALLMIQNQSQYLKLVEDIFYIYRTIGYPQQEMEKSQYANILEDPLLQNEDLALNSNAKSSYYFVYTLYYLGLNKIDKAAEIVQLQLAVYEANENFLQAHINTYISILNNLLVLLTQLDSIEAFKNVLHKIRTVPDKYALASKFIERRIFESSYSAELDFYIIKGLIHEMEPVIPLVEENVQLMGKEGVSFDRFLNLALRIAIYYYRSGDTESAHKWVKQVIENEGSQSTVHIIAYATLLDLVLHFIAGDFDYLQYRITSVRNLFKKHQRLIQVNDLFLKTLRQLMRLRTMKDVHKVLELFKVEFEKCPDSLTKRYYTKYLDIQSWLEVDFNMANHIKN